MRTKKDSCVQRLAVVIDGINGKVLSDPRDINTGIYAIATPLRVATGYMNFFSGRPCGQICVALTPARILECDVGALRSELMKDQELIFETAEYFEKCADLENITISARHLPNLKYKKD